MNIITIGGGELFTLETLVIDKYIVELAGKSKPNALFIPTASSDSPSYCDNFKTVYADRLGCSVQSLLLCEKIISSNEITDKIAEADIVYVGGGNTGKLLERWNYYNIAPLLRKAASRGCIMSGLSAGAICWYEYGYSDVNKFGGNKDWRFTKLAALGWLPGMFCPHLDAEKRFGPLVNEVFDGGCKTFACDNGAALCWIDGKASVIANSENAYAYTFSLKKKRITAQRYKSGQLIE